MLDAIDTFVAVVRNSATTWADNERLPHHPFALDTAYQRQPSLYEADVVVDRVRYTFGFRLLPNQVVEEWLYSYPTGRKRLLYERAGQEFDFGRHLPGENVRMAKATRSTVLFLSAAANNGHPFLRPIHRWISRRINLARLDESDRLARLRWIMDLVESDGARRSAEALLQFADFGISGIELHEEHDRDEVMAALRSVLRTLKAPDEMGWAGDEGIALAEREFRFVHNTQGGDTGTRLTLAQESGGTIAWLSLAVPAVEALRAGSLFLVDEIDSSLHPRLTSELISMFTDPNVNRYGAQLIFTSHDTSLLGSLHGKILAPEEVWLTEKTADGVTELYSAAEFGVRARDNLERRYLQGRYGAVPIFSRDDLRQALLGDEERVAS